MSRNFFVQSPLWLLVLTWIIALFYHGEGITFLLIPQLLFVITLAILLWQLPSRPLQLPRNPLAPCMLLFWVWLFLTGFWSLSPLVSSFYIWFISMMPAAFFLYQAIAPKEIDSQRALGIIITIGAALALHTIYENLTGLNLQGVPLTAGELNGASIFLNRNSLASLLNLILLASAVFFPLLLIKGKTKLAILLAAALFLLAWMIGLSQSRGVYISLLIALIILLPITAKLSQTRYALILACIIGAGIFIANLQLTGVVEGRLASLTDIDSAGHDRFVIWQGVFNMLEDVPWYGIGPGLFWQLYPRYRLPADESSGYFAHNDYLQFLVAGGIPMLVLLIGLLLATLFVYVKILRSSLDDQKRLEATGLFAGLLAIAIHDLFTYNLYVLSTLILIGLLLARLNLIAMEVTSSWQLDLQKIVRPFVVRGIALFILFACGALISAEFISDQLRQKSLQQIKANDYYGMQESLIRAIKIHRTDGLYQALSRVYYEKLRETPRTTDNQAIREELFNDAIALLAKNEELNPVRSGLFVYRGLLYAEHPDLGGPNSEQLAVDALSHALTLNPRLYRARYTCASILLKQGKKHQALILLEEGLIQPYWKISNIQPYLEFLLQARYVLVSEQAAREIAIKIETILGEKSPGIDEIMKNAVDNRHKRIQYLKKSG